MRHSKQGPRHPTALLETTLRSKGPPLSQEQSHKSVLGGNGKKEDFLGAQPSLSQICVAGEARQSRSRGKDFTLSGGRVVFAWVFRWKITSFHFSFFLMKHTGSLLFAIAHAAPDLVPRQSPSGGAQPCRDRPGARCFQKESSCRT